MKQSLIKKLGLEPLPQEGGYFKQMHKSKNEIGVPFEHYGDSKRAASTAIFYLLGADDFSALHRLKSDEHWTYIAGANLDLQIIHADGRYEKILIGPLENESARQLFTIPAGAWFGASINARSDDDFTLVSCVVAPGFEFADTEIGEREQLISKFPQHINLIEKYTRVDANI